MFRKPIKTYERNKDGGNETSNESTFRKPLRTYKKRKNDWHATGHGNPIVTRLEVPSSPKSIDDSLEYDPFDTTFDRLAKNLIEHPVPADLEANSVSDSSEDETTEKNEADELYEAAFSSMMPKKERNVTKRGKNKPKLTGENKSNDKSSKKNNIAPQKRKYRGNLRNENAEPNIDNSAKQKRKQKEAKKKNLQKEDLDPSPEYVQIGQKRKNRTESAVLKKCCISLERISLPHEKSTKSENEKYEENKNAPSNLALEEKSTNNESKISLVDANSNEKSVYDPSEDALPNSYVSDKLTDNENEDLHSNTDSDETFILNEDKNLDTNSNFTTDLINNEKSPKIQLNSDKMDIPIIRKDFQETDESIFKNPIVLLPRLTTRDSLLKNFTSSTPIGSKLTRGKSIFPISPINNTLSENLDETAQLGWTKVSTMETIGSRSTISPSFVNKRERKVQKSYSNLLSIASEHDISALLVDAMEAAKENQNTTCESTVEGDTLPNEASTELERESSDSMHLIYEDDDEDDISTDNGEDKNEENLTNVELSNEIKKVPEDKLTNLSENKMANLSDDETINSSDEKMTNISSQNSQPLYNSSKSYKNSEKSLRESSKDPFMGLSVADETSPGDLDKSNFEDKSRSQDDWSGSIEETSADDYSEIHQSIENLSSNESETSDRSTEFNLNGSSEFLNTSNETLNLDNRSNSSDETEILNKSESQKIIKNISKMKNPNLEPIVLLSPLTNSQILKHTDQHGPISSLEFEANDLQKLQTEDEESLPNIVSSLELADDLQQPNNEDEELFNITDVRQNSIKAAIAIPDSTLVDETEKSLTERDNYIEKNNDRDSLQPVVFLTRLDDSIRITKRRSKYRNWKLPRMSSKKIATIAEENSEGSENEKSQSENSRGDKKIRKMENIQETDTKENSPGGKSSMSRESSHFSTQTQQSVRSSEIDEMSKEDKVVYLKPGKSWIRSLSILSQIQNEEDLELHAVGKGRKWRESAQNLLLMQQKGLIQSCVRKNEDCSKEFPLFGGIRKSTAWIPGSSQPDIGRFSSRQLGLSSPGRFVRRVSIRVVPDCKSFDRVKDTSFLEAYGIAPEEPKQTSAQRCTLIAPRISLDISSQISNSQKSRDVVLAQCGQKCSLPFEECYPESYLEKCRKIGEGVYGEVFLYQNGSETRVIKIIPIEGEMKINSERQKKFDEILSEIVIAKELHNLRYTEDSRTSSFIEVKNIRCVMGKYPKTLIDLWKNFDEEKSSENDCPSIFEDDQLYIVLELGHGGEDLEAYVFQNASEAHAIFMQTAVALAVAENSLEFEHRDLHWGNLLITKTDEPEIKFKLDNNDISLKSKGVKVSVIDFTLSRMSYQGCSIFNDLSMDDDLFAAQGEYQFEVYRLMRSAVQNNWQRFEPSTNILWLHYILDKMITAVRYRRKTSKIHNNSITNLQILKNEILDYKSAMDFVTNCKEAKRLQASRSSTSTLSSATR